MDPVLVAYATREGHTQHVADRVADAVNELGLEVALLNVKQVDRPVELGVFSAIVIAASVHAGRHEKEMVEFVKMHRDVLGEHPTAFLSVSLTEATAEDPTQSAEERAEAADRVSEQIQRFLDETGWKPGAISPIAGALLYTRYGKILRWMMRRIAREAGGDTDTSVDHVYTDWHALDGFIADFVRQALPEAAPASDTG